jgi:predicted PurR-regulated permease PerM
MAFIMIYILTFFILVLLVLLVFLLFQNSKIEQNHLSNIRKLEEIISSLHKKQLYLNEKVAISSDYDLNYKNKLKNLSEEIVELQNVFISIINKKN